MARTRKPVPMDELVIMDIADGFHNQWAYFRENSFNQNVHLYEVQMLDDIDMVARVIKYHNPDFDIEKFYARAKALT